MPQDAGHCSIALHTWPVPLSLLRINFVSYQVYTALLLILYLIQNCGT